MKHIPIVIRLYDKEIKKADLRKELDIDKFKLDRELKNQAGHYSWWAALYCAVEEKVDILQQRLEKLEASLYVEYSKKFKSRRVADIKNHVILDSEYQKLRTRLRRWQSSARKLKYSAMRGFEQRATMLQMLSARERRERDQS